MKFLLSFVFILVFNFIPFAQTTHTQNQNKGEPIFKFDLGLQIGNCWLKSDVAPLYNGPSIGGGGTILMDNDFGVSFGFFKANALGLDIVPSTSHYIEDTRNRALTGGEYYAQYNSFTTPDYRNKFFFQNYKSNLNALFIGPTYYKKGYNFHVNFDLSFGGLFYQTKMNALNSSGQIYNFDEIDFNQSSDAIKNSLNNLLDNSFESQAERHRDDIFEDQAINYQFIIRYGLGLKYQFNNVPNLNIGLNYDLVITRDDLLDGQRYTEWGSLTRDFDQINRIFINANYKLSEKFPSNPKWNAGKKNDLHKYTIYPTVAALLGNGAINMINDRGFFRDSFPIAALGLIGGFSIWEIKEFILRFKAW